MKKFLLLLACLPAVFCQAQEHLCAKGKKASASMIMRHQAREAALSAATSHELKYDVKFVHLNLNLENNTTYINGGVTTVAQVNPMGLDTFMTLLHQNHTIDS